MGKKKKRASPVLGTVEHVVSWIDAARKLDAARKPPSPKDIQKQHKAMHTVRTSYLDELRKHSAEDMAPIYAAIKRAIAADVTPFAEVWAAALGFGPRLAAREGGARIAYAETYLSFEAFVRLTGREKGTMYAAIVGTAGYVAMMETDIGALYEEWESMVSADAFYQLKAIVQQTFAYPPELQEAGIRRTEVLLSTPANMDVQTQIYAHTLDDTSTRITTRDERGKIHFVKVLKDAGDGVPNPVRATCVALNVQRWRRIESMMTTRVHVAEQMFVPGDTYERIALSVIDGAHTAYTNRKQLHIENVGLLLLHQVVERRPFEPRKSADLEEQVEFYIATIVTGLLAKTNAEPSLDASEEDVLRYMDVFITDVKDLVRRGRPHAAVLTYIAEVSKAAVDPYPDMEIAEIQTFGRLTGRRALLGPFETAQDRAVTIIFMVRILTVHMNGLLSPESAAYLNTTLHYDLEDRVASPEDGSAAHEFATTWRLFLKCMSKRVMDPDLFQYTRVLLNTIDPKAIVPPSSDAVEGVPGDAADSVTTEELEDDPYGGVAPAEFAAAAAPAPREFAVDTAYVQTTIEHLALLMPVLDLEKAAAVGPDAHSLATALGNAVRSQFDRDIQYKIVQGYHADAVKGDPKLYEHAGIPAEKDIEDWVNDGATPIVRMQRRTMLQEMQTLGDRWTLVQIHANVMTVALAQYRNVECVVEEIEARGYTDATLRGDKEMCASGNAALVMLQDVVPSPGPFSYPETIAAAVDHMAQLGLGFKAACDVPRFRMTRRSVVTVKAMALFLLETIQCGWRAGVATAHDIVEIVLDDTGDGPDDDSVNDHLLSDLVIDAQELTMGRPSDLTEGKIREQQQKLSAASTSATQQGEPIDTYAIRMYKKREELLTKLDETRAMFPAPDMQPAERLVSRAMVQVRWEEYETATRQLREAREHQLNSALFTRSWEPRCDAPASFACAACAMARYDSVESQRRDWARHKPECRELCATNAETV